MAGQTLPNGQIIPPETTMEVGKTQAVTGGILNAASDKTQTDIAHQAATAKAMGAGQKGAGRKRRKLKGGAENLNAPASLIPTAGSMPGIHPDNISIENIDRLNAIRAAAAGDKLANAAPFYPAKTGGKRTKRKVKHGRSHHRTHRRRNNKSPHGRRRSRRNV